MDNHSQQRIKVIIRHCLPWGNFSTQAIEIDPKADVQQLCKKIEEKLNIPLNKQIIKYKRDSFTLRVIPGWQLQFYEIKDKSILYIEMLEARGEREGDNKINGYKMQGRYYAKLGILSTINDEDEGEEEDKINKRNTKRKDSLGLIANKLLEEMPEGENEKIVKRMTKIDLKFREDADKFLKEAKEGNFKKIKEIQSEIKSIETPGALDLNRIKKLIDEKGNGGWNSLHFAIFFGHQHVVREFIEKNADVNIETSDGWTPLQLAVHKNQLEILKILLKCTDIKINQVTNKGTALHVAAKIGRVESIQLLLSSGADLFLKDYQGKIPLEIASGEEANTLIKKAITDQQQSQAIKAINEPEILPIVKGWMYKKSGLLRLALKKRYFVMDPYEGTFIRYKTSEDCPNRPIEIIPLKDIKGIRRIAKGWLDRNEYYYLEFSYNIRFTFATETEDAINQWIDYLQKGIIYSFYIENKLKEAVDNLGITNANSNGSELAKNLQVIEILDSTVNIKRNQSPETNPLPVPSALQNSSKNIDQIRLKANSIEGPSQEIQNKSDLDEFQQLVDEKVNLQSFEVLKVLGSGAFGKVYKVRKKDTSKIYAMKVLKKRQLIMKNQLRYAVTESNVLKNAKHPFVLALHYAFQTPNSLYLVLDYCPGGDLSLHLAQSTTFDENAARFFLSELILAIEHLHSMDVIYRDLKPENILIAEDGHIKLADFGLAKEGINDDATTNSFCGSPAYLSPEMLKNKSVGKAADIYGVGTVLYEMLVGQSPYYDDDIPKLYGNIKKGKLTFPKYLSENAKAFLIVKILEIKLLCRDPNERIGVKDKNDLKNDPFFKGLDWNSVLKKEYQPPILDYMEDENDDHGLESKINLTDIDYNTKNANINRVRNFTFSVPKSQNIGQMYALELQCNYEVNDDKLK